MSERPREWRERIETLEAAKVALEQRLSEVEARLGIDEPLPTCCECHREILDTEWATIRGDRLLCIPCADLLRVAPYPQRGP